MSILIEADEIYDDINRAANRVCNTRDREYCNAVGCRGCAIERNVVISKLILDSCIDDILSQ